MMASHQNEALAGEVNMGHGKKEIMNVTSSSKPRDDIHPYQKNKVVVDIEKIQKHSVPLFESEPKIPFDTLLYDEDTLNEGIISQITEQMNTSSRHDHKTSSPAMMMISSSQDHRSKQDNDGLLIANDSKDVSSNCCTASEERIHSHKDYDSLISLPPFVLDSQENIVDDGCEKSYQRRMRLLYEKYQYPQKDLAVHIKGGLYCPNCIWSSLLEYQRDGLNWFWKLHKNETGGILCDEMGLGKTVQVISFLGSLHFSNIGSAGVLSQEPPTSHLNTPCLSNALSNGLGRVLIVAPATILTVWLIEFYKWWPYLRVIILHHTGNSNSFSELSLQQIICTTGIVLITTYSTLIIHHKTLLNTKWDYAILDEGHKIRNCETIVNTICNKIKTPHRIILTGTPIQNNLKELWCLMNFVYPGLLNSLPKFLNEVAAPITHAGYSTATELQIKTGYKCAKMLQNIIKPYMLRRTKKQVQSNIKLPKKSDYVLFCKLTKRQVEMYQLLLKQKIIDEIINGESNQIFAGLIMLRKICNHPQLIQDLPCFISCKFPKCNGSWKHSSKMIVLNLLLQKWIVDKHKVLIFSQSKKMLDIIQNYCKGMMFTYLRLDGGCSVAQRQPLINRFNTDPSINVFLLTTKVGGVGISLVAADRIILYDPDWNPSTDSQAKERAWRIGQKKDVLIYRLLTAGTVEEKMYNRQVFKQFLANRILENPGQRRTKLDFTDLHELFSYHVSAEDSSSSYTSKSSKSSMTRSPLHNKTSAIISESVEENKDNTIIVNTSVTNNSPFTNDKLSMFEKLGIDVSGHLDKVVQYEPGDNLIERKKVKKRRYKWRQCSDDESSEGDDNGGVLPILAKSSQVMKKIKKDKTSQVSITDISLVEQESERRAKEAISHLLSSDTKITPLGVTSSSHAKKVLLHHHNSPSPTITDSNSVGSAPPHSSSLLANLRNFGRLDTTSSSDSGVCSRSSGSIYSTPRDADSFASSLKKFLLSKNGYATTNDIINEFGMSVKRGIDSLTFKKILLQMCEFRLVTNKKYGHWHLKHTYL